jgi:AraC-like DNA-binding protein
VPKHHLLFIFSQVLHYSFVDYRNELRVKHARQALQKGINEYKTIESIGMDSGFPSRATFFSVFKKQTGISPGQYAENNGLTNV